MIINIGLYSFRFRWIAVVVTLLVFIILARLGYWQISRAEYKEERLAQIEQYQELNVLDLANVLTLSEQHDPTGITVKVDGIFANPASWLLDNKVVKGKTGYDVLLALQVTGEQTSEQKVEQKAVLVNMGWVGANYAYRDQLPQFTIPSGEIAITGFVKAKDLTAFALSNESINEQPWPQRIQQIELEKFEQQSGLTFHPFVVYAQQPNDYGFTHHYQPVVMPPQKHRAYAMQWFLLALAVLVIFIFASRVSTSETN